SAICGSSAGNAPVAWAGALGNATRFVGEEGIAKSGSFGCDFSALAGQMAIARSDPVIGSDLISTAGWFWFRAKVEPERFPGIPGFGLEAEAGRGFVTAMRHAILVT